MNQELNKKYFINTPLVITIEHTYTVGGDRKRRLPQNIWHLAQGYLSTSTPVKYWSATGAWTENLLPLGPVPSRPSCLCLVDDYSLELTHNQIKANWSYNCGIPGLQ